MRGFPSPKSESETVSWRVVIVLLPTVFAVQKLLRNCEIECPRLVCL